FDTFLAHPVPFRILSIPSALLSIAAVVISQTPTRQSGVPVLLLAAEVVGVVFGLAIIAATMDARSGREVSAGGAVAQATGRAVVAILSAVVELIVFVGFLLVFVTAVGVAAAAGAVAVAVAIGIVGAAVFLYVAIRWALAPAAIV